MIIIKTEDTIITNIKSFWISKNYENDIYRIAVYNGNYTDHIIKFNTEKEAEIALQVIFEEIENSHNAGKAAVIMTEHGELKYPIIDWEEAIRSHRLKNVMDINSTIAATGSVFSSTFAEGIRDALSSIKRLQQDTEEKEYTLKHKKFIVPYLYWCTKDDYINMVEKPAKSIRGKAIFTDSDIDYLMKRFGIDLDDYEKEEVELKEE